MSNRPIVLVVDDEVSLVELYKAILEESGFRVFSASNGDDARATIRGVKLDVVLSDIMMPGCNGLKVRDCAREHGVPTLLLSGHMNAYEPVIGETPLMAKPFDTCALVERVKALVAKESRNG